MVEAELAAAKAKLKSRMGVCLQWMHKKFKNIYTHNNDYVYWNYKVLYSIIRLDVDDNAAIIFDWSNSSGSSSRRRQDNNNWKKWKWKQKELLTFIVAVVVAVSNII